MRYRRYYPSKNNKDGSVSVRSYGPLTAPVVGFINKSWFVTWFLCYFTFAMLNPFNVWSTAGMIWPWAWSVSLTIIVRFLVWAHTQPTPQAPDPQLQQICEECGTMKTREAAKTKP
jgi:hypothetical protein